MEVIGIRVETATLYELALIFFFFASVRFRGIQADILSTTR